MKIIFQVSGGIGKNVAATAVCAAIKKQYPKDELIVLTGYPDVFVKNPNVSRVLSGQVNYFYPEYIEGKNSKILLHDPYHETDFIYQRGHIIKVWCEMFGIKYNGEQPELFITGKEKSIAAAMLNSPKPLMLIQTNGGMSEKADKYSWPRDLPMATAQKVVNAFAHSHTILQIRRPDQLALKNVSQATAEFRLMAALISMSSKRLFIDSFAQHAAAAMGMPSHVFWVANLPSQFGYELHNNIIANPPTLQPEYRNAMFNKYNIGDQASEFPYNNTEEIISADVLIEALSRDVVKEPVKSKKAEVVA